MRSHELSQELLAEWRQHPVTKVIRQALEVSLDQQKAALTQLYWAGQAASEADRLSLLRQEVFLEDLFEADAADIRDKLMEAER